MCHFISDHSSSFLLSGLYFSSSLPEWQWGAVSRLSALKHRGRLELGRPKMVALPSPKHDWKSHLRCRVRPLPPLSFPTVIFFLLQKKMIAWIARRTMFFSVVGRFVVLFCRLKRLGLGEKFCSRHFEGNTREIQHQFICIIPNIRRLWFP